MIAFAERLYGGAGWRFRVYAHPHDVDFFRCAEWPGEFPFGAAVDFLRGHGWDVEQQDAERSPDTCGWVRCWEDGFGMWRVGVVPLIPLRWRDTEVDDPLFEALRVLM